MVSEIRCPEETIFALMLEPTNESDLYRRIGRTQILEENGIAGVRWIMKNLTTIRGKLIVNAMNTFEDQCQHCGKRR
jgi:hypothetical protein